MAALIAGIWVYTLADILGDIFDIIDKLANPGGGLFDMMNGNAPSFGFLDFMGILCGILVIVGYFFFFRSLFRFTNMQGNEQDKASALKIKQSYILLMISIVCGWIPVVGSIAALVLLIISYVKQLQGYKGLSESAILPEEAKNGSAKIRKAIIWMLVGSILGMIPLVGGFIETIVTIVMFFWVLSGWKMIWEGAPALSEEENAKLDAEDAQPKSGLDKCWNAFAQKIVK